LSSFDSTKPFLAMTAPLLKEVDGDTLYFEFLPLVENSFGFKFREDELESIATFGQFCEAVMKEMPLAATDDCTPQQAFYKLRRALAQHVPASAITPATLLEDLLPRSRKQREKIIEVVEAELGFSLNIFSLPDHFGTALLGAFMLSLGAFFYHWEAGITGLLLTFVSGYLAGKFCLALEVKTIRNLVERMTRENYRQVRRNPNTVNRHEIVPQIQALFQHELEIQPSRLTPNALF
jgi:hypothetical protein